MLLGGVWNFTRHHGKRMVSKNQVLSFGADELESYNSSILKTPLSITIPISILSSRKIGGRRNVSATTKHP